MIFPSNLKVAYRQSQMIFLVLVYLYMMISCWTQSIFLNVFYIFLKGIRQQPGNVHCCNILLQQNNLFNKVA